MRINVYSQELTSETSVVRLESDTDVVHVGARMILHSSPMLHHSYNDDDRSAITFWLPKSQTRRNEVASAFEAVARVFRTGE